MYLLEHRCKTPVEGRRILGSALVTLPVLILVCWFWCSTFHGALERYLITGFLLMIGLIAIGHGLQNIWVNGEFICRINHEIIECINPIKSSSESFAVAVVDIVRIEWSDFSGSTTWYVRDKSGKQFAIPANYGNPAHRFVEILRSLNADIEELRI